MPAVKLTRLRNQDNGDNQSVKIQVKVKPSLRSEEISREGDNFMVNVRERSQEGKATQAAIKLLAAHFGIPQGQVSILSAFKSKDKVVEIVEGWFFGQIHID
ncbi:hypothetical protein ES703_73315 [subsurface metagenome]